MSVTSSSDTNGTVIISGPDVLQISNFYVKAGVLHPITIGSIVVGVLFACLLIGSNRSIAPITVFDWIVDIALGSTLAGIVNGNSLVRGLLALATMLGFQYLTSTVTSRMHHFAKRLMNVMRKHRISSADLNAALRSNGVLNIFQVECAIIEPNGTISVFTKELEDAKVEPDVLMAVPAYKALCEQQDENDR